MYSGLNTGAFYKTDGFSMEFVDRVSGIGIVTQHQADILMLVQRINGLKVTVATIVRHNLDTYQKHKFIHHAYPYIFISQLFL